MNTTETPQPQPMGPLEEGDQALVDAVHRLPAGDHVVKNEDGSQTEIIKNEFAVRERGAIRTTRPDGSLELVSATVDATPDIAGTHAGIRERSADQSHPDIAHAAFDTAGDGINMQPDRKRAQEIKLEAAQRIDAAREHLGETGIKAA